MGTFLRIIKKRQRKKLKRFFNLFLVEFRKEIHRILELPTNRPLMRRVDAFQFKQLPGNLVEDFTSKYLLNPHTNAKPSSGNSAD